MKKSEVQQINKDSSVALKENRQQTTGQRFQESMNTSLDEIKEIEAKPIEEAKTQISLVKDYQEQILDESKTRILLYGNVVKNYQEWVLELSRIVEDYVEAQKSVVNSVYESTIPYYEKVNREYNYWSSEIWARSVSNIAENISAAAGISKDTLFGNVEVLKISLEQAKQHAEEILSMTVNNAKAIANTASEFGASRQRSL